jgi:hypothetical protein
MICLATTALWLPLTAGPAWASPANGDGIVYVGSGNQYAAWQFTFQREMLTASPSAGMSNSKCMDAMVDWNTNGTGHFDSRVVRSCKPGTTESTGWWNEPTWGGRNINGVGKAYGYTISDQSPLPVQSYSDILWQDSGQVSGQIYTNAPGTGTSGWARVRTRYNNGTAGQCNPLPVTDPNFQGCF